MAIPEFDEYGLLPSGIFDVTEEDILVRYCGNPNRKKIWQNFNYFIHFFNASFQPKFKIHFLLDGGFTSNKPHTKDIDIIADISHVKLDKDGVLEYFRLSEWCAKYHNYADLMYKVDLYLNHDETAQSNFKGFFSYIKQAEKHAKNIPENHTKGMLRLTV